jgi:UDP-N-acetylglucosamine transferase subunit ALG13
MIFVTTGTFGFAGLIRTIDEMVARGLFDEEVIVQIGHSPYVPRHVEHFRTSPDVKTYMRRASYVFAHGGTGSMLELIQMGQKVIGVPNAELAENHQQVFLEKLHRDGSILYAPAPDQPLLLEQMSRVPTFTPAPFSFYPPAFFDQLRDDLSLRAR